MTTYANTPGPGLQTLLQHAGFVRSVARAVVRGDADVDDVVQATWLSVLEGGPKKPLPVRGWLATVTRRRAADLHRSRARVTRREHAAAQPEATASTVELAEKAELGRRMVGAVLALDEPYRSAILLRYYEDLPPREVAARLDVPVETARTRVKRGLGMLRDHFDRAEGGDRRAWMASFLPLCGGPAAVPVAAAAAGTGTFLKVALALLVLVGGAFIFWRAVDDDTGEVAMEEIRRAVPDAVLRGRNDAVDPIEIATSRTRGTIEGFVLRGDEPASARVELRRLEDRSEGAPLLVPQPDWLYGGVVGAGEPLAITTAGTDGRFAFADVGVGDYEVRAVDGGRRASARVPLRGARPASRLRLHLPDGEPVLVGRAVHADGRPFRGWIRTHAQVGMQVTIAPFGVDLVFGQGLFAVDAEGGFEVHGVSPGGIRLAAFRPDEVRYLSRPVDVPYAGTFTFVVDEGGVGVVGRVVAHEGGSPIAGAVVTASAVSDAGERAWARTRTDAEGRFTLPLPEHDMAVEVTAPGYVVRRCGNAPISNVTYHAWTRAVLGGGPEYAPLDRGSDGGVVVRLRPSPRLSGRVVERGSGRPLGGVAVYAVSANFAASGAWASATSLADGSFRFADVPAGLVTVFAASAGWVSAEVAEATEARVGALVHRLEPGASTEVLLELAPTVRASGRVVDARGAPVAGVAVRAEPGNALPPLDMGAPMWLGRAVTGEDGRFVLDPLLAGHGYRFLAQPPEGVLTTTDVVAVGSEGIADVEIRVPDAVWVNVRVVDARTGEGVASAEVRASAGREKHCLLLLPFLTGADGRVRVGPVPAVEWLLVSARAPGYLRDQDIPSTIDAREAVEGEVELRLNPAGSITGRVTAPAGISTAALIVHANLESGGRRRSNHPYQIRTDARGAFRIDGVAPDVEYTISTGVQLGLESYVARTTVMGDETSVHLHLTLDQEQTAWALSVLDPDGKPVPAAAVRLHVREVGGGDQTESGFVKSGSAVLRTHAPVDEVWVSIYGPTDAAGMPLAAGACYRHDLPAHGGEVEIRLRAPRRIAGVVRGTDGAGVPHVIVYAHPAFDPPPRWRKNRGYHVSAETDDDGAFALERLGDGEYLLVFVCPGTHRAPSPLAVAAGREDVVVVLEGAMQPRITVRDEDGAAVIGAVVAAMPVDPWPGVRDPDPSARTSGEGIAVLPALVPDREYRLRISPPQGRRDLAQYDETPWIAADCDIVLAFAAAIVGRVVDQAGDPFPQAHLLWRPEGGMWSTLALQADASFRIPGRARNQTFELYARAGFEGGNDPTGEGVVRVRPGDVPVVLEASRAREVVVRVEDWPPAAEGVMAYLLPEGGHPMVTIVQKDGTATFPNIGANLTLSFYAGPLPDGRYARTDRIVPGTNSPVATLHPGLEIRGRLDLPAGATKPSLWAVHGGMSVGDANAVAEDGTFRLRGLYPGTWEVRVSVNVGGAWKHVGVPAEAGTTDVVVHVE